MNRPLRIQIVSASLALILAGPARAQVSAGQILNNLRSEQRGRQALPTPTPGASAPPAQASAPASPRVGHPLHFVIRSVRFVGAPPRDQAALQKLVAPDLNRSIDFQTLQQAADRVAGYFQQQGRLVHVLIPAQDITAGVVSLRIVHARLGQVQVTGAPAGDAPRLRDWVYDHVPRGKRISLPALERSLLLLDDLPELAVSGALARGSEPGRSNLDLQVRPRPRVVGVASVDDYGTSSTGRMRTSGQLALNGLLGFGSRLALNAMYSTGTTFGQLRFGMPVGDDGLRMGVDASRMDYHVVGAAFQALAISGYTDSAGLHLSYPLLRTRPANLLLKTGWNFDSIHNSNAAGEVADQTYDTRVGHLELDGNWLGRGVNTAALRLSAGSIGRNSAGPYNAQYDVAGNFAKLYYLISHSQALAWGLSGSASLSGQFANRNLDSSEQMYLGGPYGLRAYNSGQLPATQGELLSLALSKTLPWNTQLQGFYDFGSVQTWKVAPAAEAAGNQYTVQDVGLGLSWWGPHGWTLTAAWAHRLGHLNPGVSQQLALNGGLASSRLWVMASLPFDG